MNAYVNLFESCILRKLALLKSETVPQVTRYKFKNPSTTGIINGYPLNSLNLSAKKRCCLLAYYLDATYSIYNFSFHISNLRVNISLHIYEKL